MTGANLLKHGTGGQAMRLIDADNIYNIGDFVVLNEDGNAYIPLADLCKLIDIQPTAYDVDKVVEQLEEEKKTSTSAKTEAIIGMCGATTNHYCGEEYAYEKAIEIVKAGGIDVD